MPPLVRTLLTQTRKGVIVWKWNKDKDKPKFTFISQTGARYELSQTGLYSDETLQIYRDTKLLREIRYTGVTTENHVVFGLYNYLCNKHGTKRSSKKTRNKGK